MTKKPLGAGRLGIIITTTAGWQQVEILCQPAVVIGLREKSEDQERRRITKAAPRAASTSDEVSTNSAAAPVLARPLDFATCFVDFAFELPFAPVLEFALPPVWPG